MKFVRTLHVNSKEIDILLEAIRMYRVHVDEMHKQGKTFDGSGPTQPKTFLGYRAKVINMEKLLFEVKNQPNPEITEKGKIPEKNCNCRGEGYGNNHSYACQTKDRDDWNVSTTDGWKGRTT